MGTIQDHPTENLSLLSHNLPVFSLLQNGQFFFYVWQLQSSWIRSVTYPSHLIYIYIYNHTLHYITSHHITYIYGHPPRNPYIYIYIQYIYIFIINIYIYTDIADTTLTIITMCIHINKYIMIHIYIYILLLLYIYIYTYACTCMYMYCAYTWMYVCSIIGPTWSVWSVSTWFLFFAAFARLEVIKLGSQLLQPLPLAASQGVCWNHPTWGCRSMHVGVLITGSKVFAIN